MKTLWIPAVHLPHGKEIFKNSSLRPKANKKLLKCYGERALLQCRPGDAIVLANMPEEDYLRFLLDRGIGAEKIIVCGGEHDNLAQDILADDTVMARIAEEAKNAGAVRFYIHLEEEYEIARRIGFEGQPMHPALTRTFNTLYFLERLEEDLGIPHIERTMARSSRFYGPAASMLEKHGAVFVRGNESCGGSQAYVIRSEGDLKKVEKQIFRNSRITRYYLSPLLDVSESWNVQYEFVKGKSFSLTGASRQILNGGYAHAGNSGGDSPPRGLMECADKFGRRLMEMGAAGTVGIDFVSSGGGVFPVEINARENTSSPAISAYRMLKEKTRGKILFKIVKLAVPRGTTFADFRKALGEDMLFDPDSGRGVLPYHFDACIVTGNLDAAVFARNKAELESAVNSLEKAI
ncbi:MAG: hypothetical protein V3S46_05835 [Nitrospinota bacterium]